MKRLPSGRCLLSFSMTLVVLAGCGGGDEDVGENRDVEETCSRSEPFIVPLWAPVTQAGRVQQIYTIKPVGCPTETSSVNAPPSAGASPTYQADAVRPPPPDIEGLGRPVATALDSEGDLWIADLQMDRLLKFTLPQLSAQPKLEITPTAEVQPAAQLLDPSGLAFDDQGTLWVSNFGQDSLVGYTADQLSGNGEQAVAPAFLIQGAGGIGLSEPNGLAFSEAGNLWVANRANDSLVAYSPGQLTAATLGASASAANQPIPVSTVTDTGRSGDLDRPIGLAFQADGDLWVSNRGTLNNLVEFDASALAESGDVAAKTTVTVPPPGPAALAFENQGDLWLLKTRGSGPDNGLVVELRERALERGVAEVGQRFRGLGDTGVATSMSFDPPPANLPLAQ